MGFSTDGPIVRISKGVGYATALLTLIFGISRVWESASGYYARKAQITQLLAAGEVQRAGADYRGAWETLEKASALQSTPEVAHAQEDVAMEWLRKIRVPEGQTFSAIVNLVSPVLTRGVLQSAGTRKADLLAHLGWDDYLRFRENQLELHPDSYFDDALKADPSNVFAHTFKAFWILWNRGPLAEASSHFRSALDGKRERQMVREFQFAALFNSVGVDESVESLRVAAEMVRNSEKLPPGTQDRIFSNIYWSSRHDAEMREVFLKALDIQDHLKMFETFYGPAADSKNYRGDQILRDFWLATLLERAGKTSEALSAYRQVKSRFDQESKTHSRYRENYIQVSEDAIRRLSSASPNR